jgi:hypothetical protein
MRLRVVTGVLALTATGIACGGGSSSGPSKAQLIAQADGICSQLHRNEAALTSQLRTGQQSEPGFYRNLADLVRTSVARLRSLRAPANDRDKINTYLNLVADNAPLLLQLAQAAEQGDQTRVQRLLGEVRDIARRGSAIAGAYGFKVCGASS